MRSLGLIVLIMVLGCRDKAPATAASKPAPTITRVVPEQVTVQGYRLGMIEGEGFDTKAPLKVWFGPTAAARAAVVSANKIQVEIPPGTDGTEVPVRVEIAGYEPATAPTKLRYISAEPAGSDADHAEHAGSDGAAPADK